MSAETSMQPLAPGQEQVSGGYRAPVAWAPVARVNQLPIEIVQNRQFKRVKQYLAAGVVVTVLVAGAATVWVQTRVEKAEQELAVVQQETTRLRSEQSKYAHIPAVLSQINAAEQVREQAMASDVPWYRYLNDLAIALPSQVWLTKVSGSVEPAYGGTPGATGGAGAAGATADPLAPPGIGEMSFEAASIRYFDVAAWLDALEGIRGIDGSTLKQATQDKAPPSAPNQPPVEFQGSAAFTEDALSHSPRYARKAG